VIGSDEKILTDMDPATRVSFVMGLCRDKVGTMTVCPYITGLTADEEATAVDAVVKMGYDSYIV
jgi:hypothetical protein